MKILITLQGQNFNNVWLELFFRNKTFFFFNFFGWQIINVDQNSISQNDNNNDVKYDYDDNVLSEKHKMANHDHIAMATSVTIIIMPPHVEHKTRSVNGFERMDCVICSSNSPFGIPVFGSASWISSSFLPAGRNIQKIE